VTDPIDPVAARGRALAALAGEQFDLLVIGGGINGVGIARDAAMRGLRAALVESRDFASGTSSRSSKLIHGGLRYLQQGDVRLVRESLRERELLRRLAPHLVRPQEFVVPVYRDGPVGLWTLGAGLWLYDLLAGFWKVRRHRMLGRRRAIEAEPALRRDGLRGAGVYWDYNTDDARLVLETGLGAARAGAVVVSYAEMSAFLKEDGRIVGARVVDRIGGGAHEVRARVVVNATGPWVDVVAGLDEPGLPRLRLTKGVHVLVPAERVGNRAAMVLNAVADGRVMFVIPWGPQALVGTTDTDHTGGPDAPVTVERSDVEYLLETVNHYFPAARLGPADVVSAFAGLRPLIAPPPGRDLDPSSVSREEDVFTSASGLITLAGGKLTTYRLIAREVVDRVVAALGAAGDARRFGPSRTHEVPLPGGEAPPDAVLAATLSRNGHGVAPAIVGHLARRYGSRLDEVLAVVARDRRLGDALLPGLPDPRAEVVEAVEREWAMTLEDVFRRRTRIALLAADAGVGAAAEVADLMGERLGWDDAQRRAAVARYAAQVESSRRWR
jgi:glycerol-3-phosphate dehydrogenase